MIFFIHYLMTRAIPSQPDSGLVISASALLNFSIVPASSLHFYSGFLLFFRKLYLWNLKWLLILKKM